MSDKEYPENEDTSDLDPVEVNETPAQSEIKAEYSAPDVEANVVPPVDEAPEELGEGPLSDLDDEEAEALAELADVPRVRKANEFIPDPHVTMTTSPYGTRKREVSPGQALPLLAQGIEEIQEIIAEYKFDFSDNAPALPKHLERIKAIVGNLYETLQSLYYRRTKKREDGDWAQEVDVGGTNLRAGRAVLSKDADPVLRVRNQLGLGELVQIPLWHSGVWITFKTPPDSALLALENRLGLEKATLGRQSNGMVFSSTEVYSVSHLLDFIFDHVYSVNLPNKEPTLLREAIVATDIPQLCWGILLSIYPAGYPLSQPCIANPDSCSHVTEALINLGRLSWTDRGKLTERQKKHMLQRKAVHTLEKVREYQSEFVFKAEGSIKVNDRISLRLRVPTIQQSFDSGFSWVEGINNATQKAFSMKMGQDERERYIQSQAMLTSLRQYAHWFEAVISTDVDGNEEVIDDKSAIDEIIEVVCSSNAMTDQVYTAVLNYIDDCSISMIALPKWTCPKCQGEPDPEYLKHPHLVPLDVINVFFILRVQKFTGKLVAEGTKVS